MTQHKKRLKKLMQSIGIQRNNFEHQLWGMRNYDEWDYITIVEWVQSRPVSPQSQLSDEDLFTLILKRYY